MSTQHRIFKTSFASVYPYYVAKAERKGRTKAEVELGLSRGPKDVPGTKERIEQLTQEAAMVRSRAMELEGELAAAELGINDLVSERADLRTQVAELETRLAEATNRAPDPLPPRPSCSTAGRRQCRSATDS